MSARATILFALAKHHHREPNPHTAAVHTLADYDATTTSRLRDYTPVWTTSDGTRIPASELACVLCDGLMQGVGDKTLLDLNAMATSHQCTPGGTA